jgi:RNA polymerase sigma-70 factor (ECF subfamily)
LKSGLSHGTAQDIVQDTIISVSKNIDHYDRTKSSFKGWLYMIVSSRIIDRLRKKQHRVKCVPLGSETFMQNASGDSTLMQTDNALEALWEKEWKNSLLQMAIERVKKRVNPRQFQMFDLYVNKEWSLTEIQQTTGASESAIRKAKERIMDAIQEEVKFLEKNPPAGF